APAHARDLLADRGEPREHGVDESAVLHEMGAAFLGDSVELLGALALGGDMARFLEIGVGGIEDAGARRMPARGLVLEHLDDLVAVARLLGDQRERDQPQVALGQHAAGAHHVVAAQAMASAEARAAAEMPTPAAARRPPALALRPPVMSHAVHVDSPWEKRYI